MTKLWIVLGAIVFISTGCEKSPELGSATPDETYREYYRLVTEGIGHEDGKYYHSKAFTQKFENQIKAAQKNNPKSYEDFMTIYFKRQQSSANCNSITLDSETIDAEVAELVYKNVSTCANNRIINTDNLISMVYEGGWKIDNIAFISNRN